MQKKLLILSILALLLPYEVWAGIYGTIEGKVLDAKGKPLAGATVKVIGTKRGANSKADGTFKIIKVDPAKYTLEASYVGFISSKVEVTVSADQTSSVTIKLKEKGSTQEVVVSTDRYKEMVSQEQKGTTRQRSGEDNTKIAVESVQQAVTLAAGVQSDGGGFIVRGSRSESTQIRVDGLDIGDQFQGGLSGSGTRTAATVSNFGVEEVQVQSGAFGAEYGNALGGVVNTIVKTGRVDKYEGLFRWRTDVPSLWGSGNNGVQAMGRNENNFDVAFGGPLPGLEGSTFFISGRNSYAQYDNNRLGVIDPWGNNLGQMPNDQLWIRNLTGRIKLGFGSFNLVLGGQLGVTAQEGMGWDWLYATSPAVFNVRTENGKVTGDTVNVDERRAKNAVLNSYQNNLMARINQIIDESSYFEITVSTNNNNSEFVKRSSFDDPSFFSGIKVVEPVDNVVLTANESNEFYNNAVSGTNNIADYFEPTTNTSGNAYTEDRALQTFLPTRSPLTGYIEGQTDLTSTKNPYGRAQFFNWTGNERSLDFRYSNYFRVDGNYNLNIESANIKHNLKAGFEFNTFTVERFYNSLPWEGNGFTDVYTSRFGGNIYATERNSSYYNLTSRAYKPWDASAFVQDQISFKGIVLSPGLRFDAFNSNVRHRADPSKFVPISALESSDFADTKTKFMISPRFSIAYPITSRSIINIGYGIYYQRPLLQYLFDAFSSEVLRGASILGNPDLDPQRTNQYQIAYNLQLSDDFAFDVTAYYKDDYNITGLSFVQNSDTPYSIYTVSEYGTSRGIEIALRKRPTDHIGFDINYTLASANTTASGATSNYQPPLDRYTNKVSIPLNEFPASYDRTHTVNAIVNFVWGNEEGPSIAGVHPLENVDIGFTGRYRTGTPYTKLTLGGTQAGDFNTERQPDVLSLDMRLTKAFNLSDWFGEDMMGKSRLEFFVDITNLINRTVATAVYARTSDPLQDASGLNLNPGDINPNVWYKNASTFDPATYSVDQYDVSGQRLYNASIDYNNDGKNTLDEKYRGYQQYVSDVQNLRVNFQFPRQVYFGMMIRF